MSKICEGCQFNGAMCSIGADKYGCPNEATDKLLEENRRLKIELALLEIEIQYYEDRRKALGLVNIKIVGD